MAVLIDYYFFHDNCITFVYTVLTSIMLLTMKSNTSRMVSPPLMLMRAMITFTLYFKITV